MQSIATTFRARLRGVPPGSVIRLALVAVPALAAATGLYLFGSRHAAKRGTPEPSLQRAI